MNYTTKVIIKTLSSLRKNLKQLQKEVQVLKKESQNFPSDHWKYGNSDDGEFTFRVSDR